MARMTIELYARRKRMLDLYYAGALTADALRQLAGQYQVKETTIRRDWDRRGTWEPLIWQMIDQGQKSIVDLLHLLKLGRERAIALMTTADQDSVKVAAVSKLTELIKTEIELRQSLGQATRAPITIEGEVKIPELAELLKQYDDIARRAARKDLPEDSDREPVDTASTPPAST